MNISEVTFLQALYKDSLVQFVLPTITIFLTIVMLHFMWRFIRFGESSKYQFFVLIITALITFPSGGFLAYKQYKDRNYTIADMQSEFNTLKTTQPTAYNELVANKILNAYSQCYSSGYADLTNKSNTFKCPRKFFYEKYLPDVVFATPKSANPDEKNGDYSLWWFIGAILVLYFVFRGKKNRNHDEN